MQMQLHMLVHMLMLMQTLMLMLMQTFMLMVRQTFMLMLTLMLTSTHFAGIKHCCGNCKAKSRHKVAAE